MKILSYLLGLMLILPPLALAVPEEGFNSGSASMIKPLQENWNSTFLVLAETPTTYRTGSSFLVYIKRHEIYDELYFLTNNHVIVRDCPSLGKCPSIKLIQKALLTKEGDAEYLEDLGDEAGVEYSGVEILKKSKNPDLALLKVTVPKSIQTPKPIKLPFSCRGASSGRLYAIGYPGTSLRTNANQLKIENQNMTYKRWSQGISTGESEVEIENKGLSLVEGTTIDALPGNSGGPVINSRGEVVGVMSSSYNTEDKNFAYDGNENLKDPSSLMIGCRTLTDFLDIEELWSCSNR